MKKFFDSPYWEERDITMFSYIMGLIPFFLGYYIAKDINSTIVTILIGIIMFILFFIVIMISHFISNTILDIILDRVNKMGEKKVIVKFLGFILIAIDLFIFICVILWSIYEAFNTGEYIVLIIIPIYYFLYYFLLSSPIGSVGNWLYDNIKIDSDKKDLKGEV